MCQSVTERYASRRSDNGFASRQSAYTGDQSHASLVHSLLDKHPGIIPRRGSCTRYNARNNASLTTLPTPLGVRVFPSSD